MATRWYFKEIYGSRYICNGKAVAFEQLDDGNGVIGLTKGQDDELIHCLDHAAANHVGGIVLISEEQYNEQKKTHPTALPQSGPRLQPGQEMLRVMQPATPYGPRDPVAADKAKPHVPKPPTPFDQPNPATPAALTPEQIAAQTSGEVQLPMKEDKGFKPATRRLSTKPPEEVATQ